jgi:hypothetical protein
MNALRWTLLPSFSFGYRLGSLSGSREHGNTLCFHERQRISWLAWVPSCTVWSVGWLWNLLDFSATWVIAASRQPAAILPVGWGLLFWAHYVRASYFKVLARQEVPAFGLKRDTGSPRDVLLNCIQSKPWTWQFLQIIDLFCWLLSRLLHIIWWILNGRIRFVQYC